MKIAILTTKKDVRVFPVDTPYDQKRIVETARTCGGNLLVINYKQAENIVDGSYKHIINFSFKQQKVIRLMLKKVLHEARGFKCY